MGLSGAGLKMPGEGMRCTCCIRPVWLEGMGWECLQRAFTCTGATGRYHNNGRTDRRPNDEAIIRHTADCIRSAQRNGRA